MSFIPNVTPADPRAPEGGRYRPTHLRYSLLARLYLALEAARDARRGREELARLSEPRLKDIGMTPEEVRRESRDWFRDDRFMRFEFSEVFRQPGVHR